LRFSFYIKAATSYHEIKKLYLRVIEVEKLQSILRRIDGKGYKAYKDISGAYPFPSYKLHIDYVQGDPFAGPSKIRVVIPRSSTRIQDNHIANRARKIRCEDFLTRAIHQQINRQTSKVRGSGKSGLIFIDAPGQQVIERTAVNLSSKWMTVCLSVGLPAQGRRVLGKQAEQLFLNIIPSLITSTVFQLNEKDLEQSLILCDQQEAIRKYMTEKNIVSFIADGSILPRKSGISDLPLKHAVRFKSPDEFKESIEVPHHNIPITGMAIYKGITLIIGGGYHGKSTLLQAIERGVYDHINEDGREFVLTDHSAFKVRSEDGRGITNVDISPFINNLPYSKKTENFSSENASGSTSQAANIIEAIEAGASTLLIDEDTSATNFMIRDSRMQALVAKEKEPITPFVDKVKLLNDDYDISTILVMGGSGDYFEIADRVIMLDQYVPHDVTGKAKEIADNFPHNRKKEGGDSFGAIKKRIPQPESLNSKKGNKNKVKVHGKFEIDYGKTKILLFYLEQLVDQSQTQMIAEALQYLERENVLAKGLTMTELLTYIDKKIKKEGLETFALFQHQHPGDLARPRMLEFAAALNRLRTLSVL
jgi:predicted ABC-class ATPase